MRTVYWHIGFGKTGTTALQSYLSLHPEIFVPATGERLLYGAILKDGKILRGENLKKTAERSLFKSVVSDPELSERTEFSFLKRELDGIFASGYTPIFSQEDWARRADQFRAADIFTRVGCSAHVIAYVRPQIEWFNSGWWQWWAWEGFSQPQNVLDAWGFHFMRWAEQIAKWKDLPGVKGVTVRLYPDHIIEDFMSIWGLPGSSMSGHEERNNVSLSPMLIKILKKYPSLRGVCDGEVDEILSRHLVFEGKTPWVVPVELAQRIIDNVHDDNERLCDMLDEPSKRIMKNDPRWWSAACYADRKVWTDADLQLNEQELFSILEQAIPAIIKLGRNAPRLSGPNGAGATR